MAAAYLTLTDLEVGVSAGMVLRLLDDDGDGVADAAVVASLLEEAERVVAGYIGRVYPLAAVLADEDVLKQVRQWARAVAVEHAFRRRTEFYSRDGTAYRTSYEDAVRMMKDVGAGRFRIDTNGTPAAPANTGGGPRYGTIDNLNPHPPFAKGGTGLF